MTAGYREATREEILEWYRESRAELKKAETNLKKLVYICMTAENPIISMSRARELLGIKYIEEMLEWIDNYKEPRE